jgi:hypothetical protein
LIFIEENKTKRNKTEQNERKRNKTKRNETKQSKANQSKAKQSKTKQNKKGWRHPLGIWAHFLAGAEIYFLQCRVQIWAHTKAHQFVTRVKRKGREADH